jgi:hypothetical protein
LEVARVCGGLSRNIFEKIARPLREIELRLRKRVWALHIHDVSEERRFIESIPDGRKLERPGGKSN